MNAEEKQEALGKELDRYISEFARITAVTKTLPVEEDPETAKKMLADLAREMAQLERDASDLVMDAWNEKLLPEDIVKRLLAEWSDSWAKKYEESH